MEQGTPGTAGRYFCSGNNRQGQSREALTYKKLSGDLQMKMLSKHFREVLKQIQPLSMKEQEKQLLDHFRQWKGNYEQIDDVLVIGVRL